MSHSSVPLTHTSSVPLIRVVRRATVFIFLFAMPFANLQKARYSHVLAVASTHVNLRASVGDAAGTHKADLKICTTTNWRAESPPI